MKHIRSKIIAICMILLLGVASPIQLQSYNGQISITKTTSVDAKKKTKKSSKKTTKKVTKKKTAEKSVTVYVTSTGSCYHKRACGRGTYYKSTLKNAKAMGLRACKKCY